MDEVTFVKTKYRMEQWERLINDRQNSGLQVDEWCEKKKKVVMHTTTGFVRSVRKHVSQYCLPYQNRIHLFPLPKLSCKHSSLLLQQLQFNFNLPLLKLGMEPALRQLKLCSGC